MRRGELDMPNPTAQLAPNNARPGRESLSAARQLIEAVLRDGLRHGFFEYTITCDIVSSGRRQLTIRAGKSHKFFIPESELT